VYSVAVSEMSPTKVALGVGDNTIRVWQPFTMPGVWEYVLYIATQLPVDFMVFICLCQHGNPLFNDSLDRGITLMKMHVWVDLSLCLRVRYLFLMGAALWMVASRAACVING
jgi:hypothetical protein